MKGVYKQLRTQDKEKKKKKKEKKKTGGGAELSIHTPQEQQTYLGLSLSINKQKINIIFYILCIIQQLNIFFFYSSLFYLHCLHTHSSWGAPQGWGPPK